MFLDRWIVEPLVKQIASVLLLADLCLHSRIKYPPGDSGKYEIILVGDVLKSTTVTASEIFCNLNWFFRFNF